MLSPLELTGRARTHVAAAPQLDCVLHADAAAALAELRAAAAEDGIDLAIVSGFRDLRRQVGIWNAKYRGEAKLLARDGSELEHGRLSERELVDAILVWSALPGASRHHWGTDLDVVDRNAAPPGYRPRLTQEEFAPQGPFARLSGWLDAHARRFGFFRPYSRDRGGAMPEPWHLSYAPVAVPALAALTLDVLAEAVGSASMDGREQVLARLPELHERYIVNVDSPA